MQKARQNNECKKLSKNCSYTNQYRNWMILLSLLRKKFIRSIDCWRESWCLNIWRRSLNSVSRYFRVRILRWRGLIRNRPILSMELREWIRGLRSLKVRKKKVGRIWLMRICGWIVTRRGIIITQAHQAWK